MATLIKTDGTETEVRPQGKKFSLEEMYALLDCTTVQMLRIPKRPYRNLWMDEDGKAARKIVNEKGTDLARLAGIAGNDFVVGDVLVTGAGEV